MSEIKKHRAFRLEDSLWKNFQDLADAREITTTSVLTKFIKECINRGSVDWFVNTNNNNVNTSKEYVDTNVDTNVNTSKRSVNTFGNTSVDTNVNTNQPSITYEEFEAKILAALDRQIEEKTSDPSFVSRIVNEVIEKKSTSIPESANKDNSESVSESADTLHDFQLNLLESLENDQSDSVANVPPIEETTIDKTLETIYDANAIAIVEDTTADVIVPEENQSTDNASSSIAVAKRKLSGIKEATELALNRGMKPSEREEQTQDKLIKALKNRQGKELLYDLSIEKIDGKWQYYDHKS